MRNADVCICVATALRAGKRFCANRFLSFHTLQMIEDLKSQLYRWLVDIGFAPSPSSKGQQQQQEEEDDHDHYQHLNANAASSSCVLAAVCAGLYPHVVHVISPSAKEEPKTCSEGKRSVPSTIPTPSLRNEKDVSVSGLSYSFAVFVTFIVSI